MEMEKDSLIFTPTLHGWAVVQDRSVIILAQ